MTSISISALSTILSITNVLLSIEYLLEKNAMYTRNCHSGKDKRGTFPMEILKRSFVLKFSSFETV